MSSGPDIVAEYATTDRGEVKSEPPSPYPVSTLADCQNPIFPSEVDLDGEA